MILIPHDATSVREPIEVFDAARSPALSLTHASAITISYRRPTDTAWTDLTLVAGGTAYVASGFRSLGGNIYEVHWPDAAIVSGQSTLIRYTYDGVTRYDVISARLPSLTLGGGGGGSANVESGLFAGSTIRVFQDDDYSDNFALVFTITHPTRDYSVVTGALFGAGVAAGTPLISATPTVVTNTVGLLVLKVEIPKGNLQIAAQTYRYTLKVLVGTARHTVNEGTLSLDPTYITFSS